MFDVELLKNIKSLEADIQRQENTADNDIFGLQLVKLKADLNSMKGSYFFWCGIFK